MTDIGGLNDKGFNALAAKGLKNAEKQLGVTGRVFISKTAADYIPNLSSAARGGYDLVIANGFLMGDATAAVAKRFPDTNFAIIDFPWVALKGKPKNVRGLIFKEAEAGYLAGVAAATVANGEPVSVGRRPGRPGRRRVPRRLQGRARRRRTPSTKVALGLLAGLRRPGEVQGARD